MTRGSWLGFAVAGLVAIGAAHAQETGGWNQYKPGTWTHTRTTSVTDAPGMKIEAMVESRTTLKEVSAAESTVEVETTTTSKMNGVETKLPPQSNIMKIPNPVAGAVAPAASPAPGAQGAAQGEETVTVGGKSYKCKTSKLSTPAGGATVTAKTWFSDTVPGALVKSESTTEGETKSTIITELVDFEIKK